MDLEGLLTHLKTARALTTAAYDLHRGPSEALTQACHSAFGSLEALELRLTVAQDDPEFTAHGLGLTLERVVSVRGVMTELASAQAFPVSDEVVETWPHRIAALYTAVSDLQEALGRPRD